MTTPRTITAQQLDQLPEEVRRDIEAANLSRGAGNRRAWYLYNKYIDNPLEEMQRRGLAPSDEEQPSPAEVREQIEEERLPRVLERTAIAAQTARTVFARTQELMAAPYYLGLEQARDQAVTEVSQARNVERDIAGRPAAAPSTPERIVEMGGFEAVGESMRKQRLRMPAEVLQEQNLESRVAVEQNRILQPARIRAVNQAEEQNLEGEERRRFVQAQTSRNLDEILSAKYLQFYQDERAVVLEERGLEDLPPRGTPENNEIRQEINRRAVLRRRQYENLVTPERLEEQGVITEGVDDEGRERFLAESHRDRMMREGGRPSLRTGVRRFGRGILVGEDTQGVPIETAVSQLGRNITTEAKILLGWIPDVLTWERDAETGEPLDTDDPQYRLHQRQNEALEALHELEQAPRLDPDEPLPTSGALFSNFLGGGAVDVDMETRRALTDADNPARNASLYLREIAMTSAAGGFLGDDLMAMPNMRLLGETVGMPNLGFWWGVGIEVFVPVGGTVTVAGKAARLSGTALHAAGRLAARATGTQALARAGRTAEVVSSYLTNPVNAARFHTARTTLMREIETLTPEAMRSTKLRPLRQMDVLDSARLPVVASEMLARDMALRVARGGQLYGAAAKLSPVQRSIQNAFETLRIASTRLKTGSSADFMKDLLGRELLEELRVAEAAMGAEAPIEVLHHAALRGVASRRISEVMANVLPNDWVVVSSSIMVKEATVKRLEAGVRRTSQEVFERIGSTGKGSLHSLKNPNRVADLLVEAVGRAASTDEPWHGILQKLRNYGTLTSDEYLRASDQVIGQIWKNAARDAGVSSHAFRPTTTGAAVARAEVPLNRRYTLFRNVEDMYRGVRSAMTGSNPNFPTNHFFKSVLPDWSKHAVPVQLKGWFLETDAKLKDMGRSFRKMFEKARLSNPRDPVAAYETAIARFAGDPVDDMIELVGSWFPNNSIHMNNLEALIKAAAPQNITIDEFIRIIDHLKASNFGSRLGKGLGTHSKGDDYLAAFHMFGMNRYRAAIMSDAAIDLERRFPRQWIDYDAGVEIESAFIDGAIRGSLQGKVSGEFIDELVEWLQISAQGINTSDRHAIMRKFIDELYTKGGMGTPRELRNALVVERLVGSESTKVALVAGSEDSMGAVRAQVHALAERHGVTLSASEIDDVVLPIYLEALTSTNLENIMGLMNSIGMPARAAANTAAQMATEASHLVGQIVQLKGTSKAILVGGGKAGEETAKIIDGLFGMSVNKDFESALRALTLRDAELGSWMSSSLGGFVQAARRSTIGGLLGGFPLPAFRHLGINSISAAMITAITAPSMVLTTLGRLPRAVVGSFAEAVAQSNLMGLGRTVRWIDDLVTRAPNSPVMVDRYGRSWTQDMISTAMDRQNVRFTQITFEMGDNIFKDVNRIAGIGMAGGKEAGWVAKASWFENAKRWINPANKNLWSVVAERSDMIFREGVFIQALKNGLTEAQAGQMARVALLDYGAIPQWERDKIARYSLFYAFRRQMFQEVASAFVRNGNSLNAMRSMMVWVRSQHDSMGAWALEPDYARSRLWASQGTRYQNYITRQYGPDVAPLTSFITLTNMFEAVMNPSIPNILNMAGDAVFTAPIFDKVSDVLAVEGEEYGEHGGLDANHMVLWEQLDAVPLFTGLFDLTPVDIDRERPDRMLIDQRQWQFNSGGGRLAYIAYTSAALMTGLERFARDYTQAAILAGIVPADVQPRREDDGNPYLYSIGGESTYSYPDWFTVIDYNKRRLIRDLQQLGE